MQDLNAIESVLYFCILYKCRTLQFAHVCICLLSVTPLTLLLLNKRICTSASRSCKSVLLELQPHSSGLVHSLLQESGDAALSLLATEPPVFLSTCKESAPLIASMSTLLFNMKVPIAWLDSAASPIVSSSCDKEASSSLSNPHSLVLKCCSRRCRTSSAAFELDPEP